MLKIPILPLLNIIYPKLWKKLATIELCPWVNIYQKSCSAESASAISSSSTHIVRCLVFHYPLSDKGRPVLGTVDILPQAITEEELNRKKPNPASFISSSPFFLATFHDKCESIRFFQIHKRVYRM